MAVKENLANTQQAERSDGHKLSGWSLQAVPARIQPTLSVQQKNLRSCPEDLHIGLLSA